MIKGYGFFFLIVKKILLFNLECLQSHSSKSKITLNSSKGISVCFLQERIFVYIFKITQQTRVIETRDRF